MTSIVASRCRTVCFRFQFGLECGTKAVQPLGVFMQGDELPCQFLVVMLGDIIPYVGQIEWHGFHAPPDFPVRFHASGFIPGLAANKRQPTSNSR